MFVSAEGRFVSLRLAEGRRPKGSGDVCEGRVSIEPAKLSNEAPKRPSGHGDAAPFQAAERRSARRSGSWFAPVGANLPNYKTCLAPAGIVLRRKANYAFCKRLAIFAVHGSDFERWHGLC